MDKRKQRGGLVGPVVLIGLGVVFLLNNLGILEWDVWWALLRIWPVFLVAAGIDLLIGRRSFLGSLLALVLIVAVFAGAFWLAWKGAGAGPVGTGEEISQALGVATEAEIIIEPAVGTLHVEALPESSSLIEGTVRLGSGERLEREYKVEDGVAKFILQSEGVTIGPFIGVGDERVWDLGLNTDVPLDLEISLGAGQSDVDLRGLTVSDLNVGFGVGQTTLTLPVRGSFQAKVDGAIGQVIIIIPRGMEARVRLDTALVARQLPDGYRCQDDVCTSPGYTGGENRVDLEVDLAIGNVSIRTDR